MFSILSCYYLILFCQILSRERNYLYFDISHSNINPRWPASYQLVTLGLKTVKDLRPINVRCPARLFLGKWFFTNIMNKGWMNKNAFLSLIIILMTVQRPQLYTVHRQFAEPKATSRGSLHDAYSRQVSRQEGIGSRHSRFSRHRHSKHSRHSRQSRCR